MRKFRMGGSSRRGTSARLRKSRVVGALVAVLAVSGAVFGVVSAAQAAIDDADHTVTGVSPRGTTINLFDYWIQSRDASDQTNGDDYQNRGINAGHVLKFGAGMGTQADETVVNTSAVNHWTSSAAPRQGIVAEGLGDDGYPVLSGTGGIGTDSLGYLFDSTEFEGKAAYMDVDGLLQVDDQGYYYYNSQQNFAQFNEDTDNFTLYRAWGVKAAGSSPNGQFFPFNNAAGNDQGDGAILREQGSDITQTDITSTNAAINHYFGLNMSTRFVQQDGGYTAPQDQGGVPVTYEFSGDDDVWIYIDGVLVGDLGGIHDASSISINFATGDVVINEGKTKQVDASRGQPGAYWNGQKWVRDVSIEQHTTLGDIMRDAGVTNGLDGDTFADDTYHTLDFFYLERGNTDSNMSLKYNLVNIPESGIVKVDQYGTERSGVQFTLRQANAQYEPVADATTVSGRTDANGEMIFTYKNSAGQDMPITLEQMGERSAYWILEETESDATAGYRNPGTVELRFSTINRDGTGDGVLLSSNQWETGAYSQAHVTATAPTNVTDVNNGTHESADGLMFAVVAQIDDQHNYHPVTGDAFTGWDVADATINDASTSKEAIVTAAKASGYQFLLGSGGAYQTTIEDLPGDINTYEYMLTQSGGNPDDAQYAVKYYWSNATSFDDLTANSDIYEINPNAGDGFERIFSVTLSVPNIKNELSLVKTDVTDAASPAAMQGVEFKLYADDDHNGVADGQTALSTLTTDENGELQVYSNMDEQILANGSYVLAETTPADYQEETEPIQIVVDDDGVHVNAGEDDDNVTVETGIGNLVYSMRGFAADDKVDSTLHEVKAQPQTSDAEALPAEDTGWANQGTELHFQYRDKGEQNQLTYQPSQGNDATYTADAGWSRFNVTQCMDSTHATGNGTDYKQNLGNQSLNALFTGDVTIHVTNKQIPTTSSLTISKTVTGEGASTSREFTYTLGLTDDAGQPLTGSYTITKYDENNDAIGLSETITNDGTFTLTHNQYAVIDGLPIGATYSVTEAATAYYDPSVTPGPGTVDGTTGNLTTTGTIDQVAANNTVAFTNTFWGGSVDYDYATDVNIAKTFNGRDMKQGETFTVNVQPKDDQSAQLFGLTDASEKLTIPFTNLNDGVTSSVNLLANKDIKFTAGNVGTYEYTVSEERPADNPSDGIAYDETSYTLTITVSADGDGVVTVKTSATDGKDFNKEVSITGDKHVSTGIELPFTNTYNATGELGGDAEGATAIEAHKTLNNDTLKGDDFTFSVWTVNSANETVDKVSEAKNDADGDIMFPAIEYTTESLKADVADGVAQKGVDDSGKATYTYVYRVMEDTADFAENGLSTAQASFDVTVVVTDNGNGTLGFTVTYPQGSEDGLEFVNTYGASAKAQLNVAGTKIYETNGLENAPNIEGKYTFTLTGVDEKGDPAPLPATTTAQNQANGTVDFGTINYDIADLDGADSKTFTYTVTESGSVAGVDNDAAASEGKTFSVTLIDNQDGTISVDAAAQQAAGSQFSFTNTYDADPTVPTNPTDPTTGNLTITKTLDGRTLNEGEFSFTMAAAGDYGDAVSPASITATNTVNEDGTGSVVFGDGFTFAKPGDYAFTISEDNNDLGGVSYDGAVYTAVAHVEDDGAGALTATWTVTDAEGQQLDHITFANSYEAAPTTATLSVTKELKGGALAAGQFSFELTGSEGAPMPEATTATNAADGTVSFGATTFDKAGEYDYTVTEINDGQDGVTYDENADRTIHVSVTDNGEGSLVAEVSYGEDGSHFVNTFAGTGSGITDGTPGSDGPQDVIPQTGDQSFAYVPVVALLGVAVIAGGVLVRRYLRRE